MTDADQIRRRRVLIERLDKAIQNSGLSFEEISGPAKLGETYLRKLIYGGDSETKDPGFFKIMAVARLVKVSPHYLAGETDDPAKGLI